MEDGGKEMNGGKSLNEIASKLMQKENKSLIRMEDSLLVPTTIYGFQLNRLWEKNR